MTSNGAKPPRGLGEWLIALVQRGPAGTLAEQTRRRVTLRLIPFLFFLYILAYLDRVNVSVAQLGMEKSVGEGGLGFDRATIGFGAGIFFWGYWILEIPSTVSVTRWGARWVFVRILILWGICAALLGTIGTPFADRLFSWIPHIPAESGSVGSATAQYINGLHDNPAYQFYFFRFMLGFFEGGFFPSVIVYLSLWFRTEDRAKAIASFMAAIPFSSMLGSPLSGLLLGVDWFGLAGWRWVFLTEGIVPILAGFVTIFFLPDRPAKAKWLSPDERDWLLAELDAEHLSKQGHGHWAWVHHLGMVLLLTLVYFCLNLTSYGLSMFMPAIIKSQTGASSLVATFLASVPFFMGLMAMLVNGWHSDRTGERPLHVAVPLCLLGVGIFMAALTDGMFLVPALIMMFWVGTCMYAHLPAFWPIPTMFLGATAAASAIGFINMIGNLGGSVGPMLVGGAANVRVDPLVIASTVGVMASPQAGGPLPATSVLLAGSAGTGSFAAALLRLGPWPIAASVIILVVGYLRSRTKRGHRPA
jgi:sugar phosphate permease